MRIIYYQCEVVNRQLKLKRLLSVYLVTIMILMLSACAGQSAMETTSGNGGDNRSQYDTVSDVFSMDDTNNDGYLDRQEFVKFQANPEIMRLRNRVSGMHNTPFLFEEIDENGDEHISRQEMQRAVLPQANH